MLKEVFSGEKKMILDGNLDLHKEVKNRKIVIMYVWRYFTSHF